MGELLVVGRIIVGGWIWRRIEGLGSGEVDMA